MRVPSTLADVKGPEALILGEVARCGYDEDATFAIKLALEEAMTNAVRHGNRGDGTKHIHVSFRVTPEAVVISIRDEGPGFSPEEVPDPTTPDRIALPSGRGIMLMRAYMTDVQYRANGTEVWLVKKNPRFARKSKATKGA
jgi:serine/threonine-protein kinase RsbW